MKTYAPGGGEGFCQLTVSDLVKQQLSISPTLQRAATPKVAPVFQDFRVSSVGQMSLPAGARRRWGMSGGGTVEIADLGFGLLLIPGTSRGELFSSLLSRDELQAHIESIADDPDLGT